MALSLLHPPSHLMPGYLFPGDVVDWTLRNEKQENHKRNVDQSKDQSKLPVVEILPQNLKLILINNWHKQYKTVPDKH